MSESNEKSLRTALLQYVRAMGMEERLIEAQIKTSWADFIGPTLAKKTYVKRLDKGVLHVVVDHALLRHELRFYTAQWMEQLNAELGKPLVHEIRLL